MHIDDTVLAKLEKLSHLYIDEDKKEEVKIQLSGILSYIDNLNTLETEGLCTSFSTLEGGTPLREDSPRKSQTIAKDVLSYAPQAQDDYFVVPAIID